MAIYGLLVGINEYHPDANVNALSGCVNDVLAFQAYLQKNFPAEQQVRVLLNQEATREQVIDAFKTHLTGGHVRDEDIVVFYYSGHGSYAPSAPEFIALGLDTRQQDETLVLYDSRLNGRFDLADKELALLLAAVNQSASIVVILDSCHSGSATRAIHIADEIRLGAPRFTPAGKAVSSRTLDQYLAVEGFDYSKMPRLEVPVSRHILLAACGRDELAYEAAEPNGLFSGSLIKIIGHAKPGLTYANLYQHLYTVLKRQASKQTPQLKVYGGFNPNRCFLSREASGGKPACEASYNGQEWILNFGALHGMPVKETILQDISVVLYDKNRQPAGTAAAIRTRLTETVLRLEAPLPAATAYEAEIVNLPPSLCIYVQGNAGGVDNFFATLEQQQERTELLFHRDRNRFYDTILDIQPDDMRIMDSGTQKLLHGIRPVNAGTIGYITNALLQIGKWKTLEKMQQAQTRIPENDIIFGLQIRDGNGLWTDCEGNAVTLDLTKEKPEIPFRLKLASISDIPYYVALYRLTPEFAIEKYTQDVDASLITREKTPAIECNTPDNDDPYTFFLDDDTHEETEIYKLVVSKEVFYDYFIEQRTGLKRSVINEIPGITRAVKPASKGDWLVKTLTVRLVKQIRKLDAENGFSNTVLSIQPHAGFTAGMALTPIKTAARGFNPLTVLDQIFSGENFSFLNLAPASKGGAEQSVVELTDINGEGSLLLDPLKIDVHYTLHHNEQVMAVGFSDGIVVPLGLLEKSADGNDHHFFLYQIPVSADARREAGKNPVRALWFCFLKVVLKKDDIVFKLRSVEYINGQAGYSKTTAGELLKDKSDPLLMIHGIIGNTRSIAANLEFLVKDEQYPYDAVIAFDYENLDTGIETIASRLKDKLLEAGISEHKKIDILAHSMGGLVSRYLVEKLDGDRLVNRMFLVGVPNSGSAFGKLATMRTWATGILTLVCNYGKQYLGQFGPFLEAFNGVLVAAKPVTNTLAQMNEGSDFLKELNRPGGRPVATKYFVLAGNTADYLLDDEPLVKKTMEKIKLAIGKLAYWSEANDIAVSVQSIKKIPSATLVKEIEAGCHHMNYFDYNKSLLVLKELMKP